MALMPELKFLFSSLELVDREEQARNRFSVIRVYVPSKWTLQQYTFENCLHFSAKWELKVPISKETPRVL